MISEKQLADWERLCNEATEGPWHMLPEGERDFICAARRAVPALIARVRELEKGLDGLSHENTALLLQTKRLEKEADWLAKKASAHSPCIDRYFDCLAADQLNQCHICWREAARKVVNND